MHYGLLCSYLAFCSYEQVTNKQHLLVSVPEIPSTHRKLQLCITFYQTDTSISGTRPWLAIQGNIVVQMDANEVFGIIGFIAMGTLSVL